MFSITIYWHWHSGSHLRIFLLLKMLQGRAIVKCGVGLLGVVPALVPGERLEDGRGG